jgi:hypothetical protein
MRYELLGEEPDSVEAFEYLRYLEGEPKVSMSARIPRGTLARLDALANTMHESRSRTLALMIDASFDQLVSSLPEGDHLDELAFAIAEQWGDA